MLLAHLSISNNTFTNNTRSATSGATYLIYNSGAVASSINMNNNNLSFNHVGATAYSGALYNVYNGSGTTTTSLSISNNILATITTTLSELELSILFTI
ncbi:MAG: hypothetical protein IPG08_02550 [Sphingobacteriaceae bacterium]|nr:hypothetical protein [Sphingobacteriaceae bacterium]